jgi:hypothetical protein
LIFLRRVRIGSRDLVQGFLVDWPRLQDLLLSQVADLFIAARIEPLLATPNDPAYAGMAMATIPAGLGAMHLRTRPVGRVLSQSTGRNPTGREGALAVNRQKPDR